MYGEKYSLGNPKYEIEDALPPPKIERKATPKFPKAQIILIIETCATYREVFFSDFVFFSFLPQLL